MRIHEVRTLVLYSPGGSLPEGLQLSGMVFDKGLTTYIPENGVCASACSFVFLAGEKRFSDGKLGVHQFSYKDGSGPDKGVERHVQYSVSDVIGYLSEYQTPAFVYERMFTTPPEDMYYFTVQEMNELLTKPDQTEIGKIQDAANLTLAAIQKAIQNAPEDADSITTKPSEEEIILLVQSELNRLGCSVGKADGVIGPASRRGLARFAKHEGIDVDQDVFSSHEFLKFLQDKPENYCPKPPPAPLVGKLGRDWTMLAKCRGTIRGAMTIHLNEIRGNQAVYAVQYQNSVGQYWRGYMIEGSRDFSLRLKLVSGRSPYKTLHADGTIASNRREATGRSSDGCIFHGQVVR